MMDSMAKLQYTFQKSIMDRFRTNNLLVDYLLTSTIFEPLGAFRTYQGYFSYATQTLGRLFRFIRWLGRILKSCMLSRGRTLRGPTSRTVEIHYITPQSRKNFVYEQVQWFLESAVETVDEPRLLVYCEEPLNPEAHPPPANLQKGYPTKQAKSYRFDYRGFTYEIFFEFSKRLIKVYGDKERTKEDLVISLWIEDPAALCSVDGTDVLEAFIQKCICDYRTFHASQALKPTLYSIKSGQWHGTPWKNQRSLSTIILKEGQMEMIRDQLDWFMSNEKWYAERGLPYKLVFLFHGPPGTGKSAIMNGICTYLKRPYRHNLSLATIRSDDEFRSMTSRITYPSTVVYCDDVDTLTDIVLDRSFCASSSKTEPSKSDESKESKKALTLGTLLEWMDGDLCHGMVAGFMTNYPERLDKAFVREGRIDIAEHLDNCNLSQLGGLFTSFYRRLPEGFDSIAWSPAHLTPAAVQKVFCRHRSDPEKALECLQTYKSHSEVIRSKHANLSKEPEII